MGALNKYYKDGYWYKQNIGGYEGKAEAICTILLDNSNIDNYVSYEECLINGVAGCRSKNFLQKGETLVTFQRLYSLVYGGDLSNKISTFSNVKERIGYVVDFIKGYTDFDCLSYLRDIVNFDMLSLNVDRHFHNLGVIQTVDGYRQAPIFDNGVSFFSLQKIFPPEKSIEEKLQIMTPKPFSGDFEQQAFLFESKLMFDYDNIRKKLQYESSYVREIVLYQLDKYKDRFPDFKIHRKKKNQDVSNESRRR